MSVIKRVDCTNNNSEVERALVKNNVALPKLWLKSLRVRFYGCLKNEKSTICISEKKSLAVRFVVGPGGGVLGYFPTFVY